MLLYPPLAYWLFDADPRMAGYFLGASIHDTAQVAGAALIYRNHFNAPETLDVATVTKLVRNTMMVLVVPLLGFLTRRNQIGADKAKFRWSRSAVLCDRVYRRIGGNPYSSAIFSVKPFLLSRRDLAGR